MHVEFVKFKNTKFDILLIKSLENLKICTLRILVVLCTCCGLDQ